MFLLLSVFFFLECQGWIDYNVTDPHAKFYEDDMVHEIRFGMKDKDWKEMKTAIPEVFDQMMKEAAQGRLDQKKCMDKPMGNDFDNFHVNVTFNGKTLHDVGSRNKGFVGSLYSDPARLKPSMNVKMDRFVDGQEFEGFLERFTLNNNAQFSQTHNTSEIHGDLSYRVFRHLGIKAPRSNHAKVWVNDEFIGVYSNIEPIKKVFLRHNYDGYDDGNLYEFAISDFTSQLQNTIEKKNNEKEDDYSDVFGITAALENEDTVQGFEQLKEIINLDQFLTFWCAEILVGHVDGYAANSNNVYLYNNGRNGKNSIEFIPWGTDWTFALMEDANVVFSREPATQPFKEIIWANSALTLWLWEHQRVLFVEKMKEMLEIWDADLYIGWATTTLELLWDAAADMDPAHQPDYEASHALIVDFLKHRKGVILNDLEGIMNYGLPTGATNFYSLLCEPNCDAMMPIMMEAMPCTTDCWPCQLADCWDTNIDAKDKDPTCHKETECSLCFMCGIMYNKCRDYFLACTEEGCNAKTEAKPLTNNDTCKEDTYMGLAIALAIILLIVLFVLIFVMFRNKQEKEVDALTPDGGTAGKDSTDSLGVEA